MTIAGYEILNCPFCTQTYKKIVIASFNTFDIKPYSDGYVDGNIPQSHFPSVIKCINKKCGQFFTLKEPKVIAEIGKDEYDTEEWKQAQHLSSYKIEISELYEALVNDFCNNPENEKTVRLLLLRKLNDIFRENRKYQLSEIEAKNYISNIDKLIRFSQDDLSASGKIFLAELYREKGDFNSCIEILNTVTSEDENEKIVKEKVYSQAKVRDNKVFNLHLAAPKKEYQCNKCGHNIILFDLTKMNSNSKYQHYKCNNDKTIFNAHSKERNPKPYYKLNFFQKLFKLKKPYEHMTTRENIPCPSCTKSNVEIFNPDAQKCVQCGNGNYKSVKWFN